MLNLNRLDGTEIDQMLALRDTRFGEKAGRNLPYGFAFDGNHPVSSGILVQHGNYHPDRTSDLPSDSSAYIAASGTYPFRTMPRNREGCLDELGIASQEEAFRVVAEQIKIAFPEGAEPVSPTSAVPRKMSRISGSDRC